MPGGDEIKLIVARSAEDEEKLRTHLADMAEGDKRIAATCSAFEMVSGLDPAEHSMGVKYAVVTHYSLCFKESMDPTLSMAAAVQETTEKPTE